MDLSSTAGHVSQISLHILLQDYLSYIENNENHQTLIENNNNDEIENENESKLKNNKFRMPITDLQIITGAEKYQRYKDELIASNLEVSLLSNENPRYARGFMIYASSIHKWLERIQSSSSLSETSLYDGDETKLLFGQRDKFNKNKEVDLIH